MLDTNLPEGSKGIDDRPDTPAHRHTGRPPGARGIGQHPVRDALNGQLSAGGEHRLPLTPVLVPEFPEVRAAWCHGRRIETAGMPAVPEFGDAPPRPGAIAADPNGRGWLLHWARRCLHILVLVHVTLAVHHPVRPDSPDLAEACIAP